MNMIFLYEKIAILCTSVLCGLLCYAMIHVVAAAVRQWIGSV